MSKIRVLPEVLANKIAAGEIVERPASVVKELLENSIDAGSASIRVCVEAGGKKLISVFDDGEGMSQDDAILAFEHHATSKLHTAEDLSAIATLGFRGEALPSIASISDLGLKTRRSEIEAPAAGTEINIQGGTMRSVKAIAWDRGTEITVRNLFFNVPARRKFLRSHETELGHITRLVTHYALAYPETRYYLESDGRKLIDVTPVSSVRERVYQLFGEEFLKDLVEISRNVGETKIHGFSSLPHEQRTNPYSLFFYVNRRMIRDKVIMSAVRQAYQNCIPGSVYPVALVFLTVPHDQVDVNAHPAKTEIRFRQQSLVHDLVRDSIVEALTRSRSVAGYDFRVPSPAGIRVGGEPPPADFPLNLTVPPIAPGDPFQRAFSYPFREIAPSPPVQTVDHESLNLHGDMLWGAEPETVRPFNSGGVRILGQIQESYIIACDSYGLLIIDQHVAHERILYEKLAGAIRREGVETQGLLTPLSVELAPHQIATLKKIVPELMRSGFDLEHFGGNTVLIRSVPSMAKEIDCRKLLAEILEGLEREERTLDVDRIRDRMAVSMACRAAIKVHMPLTIEKMQWLIDELSQTRIPTNCPHGRPIILRFSLYEIERNFGRI